MMLQNEFNAGMRGITRIRISMQWAFRRSKKTVCTLQGAWMNHLLVADGMALVVDLAMWNPPCLVKNVKALLEEITDVFLIIGRREIGVYIVRFCSVNRPRQWEKTSSYQGLSGWAWLLKISVIISDILSFNMQVISCLGLFPCCHWVSKSVVGIFPLKTQNVFGAGIRRLQQNVCGCDWWSRGAENKC